MSRIARSLAFALGKVLHPRMLWLMLWPALIAVGIWGTVALVFWAQLALWLAGLLGGWIAKATFFVSWDATDVALVAAKILILLTLVPLIQLTVLLILGIFGMPAMVEHVAARRFPALQRRHGGSFAGSVWNSVLALLGLLALGVVSLPFWILPPLWPLIPLAVMGWVNQRVLRYDALAEHADASEMGLIFAERRGALYMLGMVLALTAYIPVLGFFAPVMFGLTFIHYLLAELQAQRAAPIEAGVIEG
ncbi:MAG TPA: EI24 domain-containing protein [Burkholderiales bacterium]|nr:EI24 domain-containing protein [Burkholderiales bacterium]